jgi:putative peptidoglycan lipid II flippase
VIFPTLAVLSRYWGIYGAAVGAVIGASLHLLIQVPGLIRTHARWQPILDWSDPELRTVIKLMIPRAAGLAISNMYLLIATNMASTIARETGVAAFNRGWTLMQLPQTLIGTAMGIVIFPTLAVLSAAGDLNGKRAAMSGSLRFILVASIPAALLMVTAGRPLVGVLEGGQFDTESANRVFLVLQMFALGIITHSGVEIVARSFYADKDMVTPLLVNVVELALFLVLASQFTQMFGVAGLALANSIAVGVELIILMVILRRKWNGIDERTLFTTTIKTIIASAVMGVVTLIAAPIVESVLPGGRFGLLAQAAVLIGLGGVVFLVVGFLLRMQELVELPQILLRRRRNPVPEAALGD